MAESCGKTDTDTTAKQGCRDGQDSCEKASNVEEKDLETEPEAIPDCPVCLQTCSYPVKLACGHIFCFLCIKGVVFRSKRCALCRQDVDLDYFKNPVVVKSATRTPADENDATSGLDHADEYLWYYEGRNGWWQYDDSSSAELEKAHKDGNRSFELLIAGFLYFIDFENMVQFRKTEPGRRRRIKRDVVDAEKKGVAGLRIENRVTTTDRHQPEVVTRQRGNTGGNDDGGTNNDEQASLTRPDRPVERSQPEPRSAQQHDGITGNNGVGTNNDSKSSFTRPDRQSQPEPRTTRQRRNNTGTNYDGRTSSPSRSERQAENRQPASRETDQRHVVGSSSSNDEASSSQKRINPKS